MGFTQHRRSLPFLILLAATLTPGVTRAEAYHSTNYGYNLTIPTTWKTIPPDVVQTTAGAVLNANSQNKVICDAGFQVRANSEWFEYPYVLVQIIPYSKFNLSRQISEDEFPKVMQAITGADVKKELDSAVNSDVRPLLSDASLGQPQLDKAKRRYTVPVTMNVAGAGKIRGLVVGHFGHEAIVQVCYYAMDTGWEKHVGEGQAIINSFSFDGAKAYRPEESNSIWNGVMQKGIIGGIIGGVVGLFMWMRKKKA